MKVFSRNGSIPNMATCDIKNVKVTDERYLTKMHYCQNMKITF